MDKRIIRTRSKIKAGVLSIYARQPLENYPISYLCKEIGLNRTTFYIHYSCIDDVVEEIANDCATEIFKLLRQHESDVHYCAEALTKYIVQNETLVSLVVNESKGKWINNTIDLFSGMLHNTPLIENIYDKYKKEYTMNFVVFGAYGILSKWVKDDLKQDRTVIVKRLVKFINSGE